MFPSQPLQRPITCYCCYYICCARITDVSIGTLRIIFVSKGLKYWAAALGFVESLIWILAITKVMQDLGDWQTYVAFACGFSAGNF